MRAEADVSELWERLFRSSGAEPYYRAGSRPPPSVGGQRGRPPRPGDWLSAQPLSVAFAERAATSIERDTLLQDLTLKVVGKPQGKEKKQKVQVRVEIVPYEYNTESGTTKRMAGKSKLLGTGSWTLGSQETFHLAQNLAKPSSFQASSAVNTFLEVTFSGQSTSCCCCTDTFEVGGAKFSLDDARARFITKGWKCYR